MNFNLLPYILVFGFTLLSAIIGFNLPDEAMMYLIIPAPLFGIAIGVVIRYVLRIDAFPPHPERAALMLGIVGLLAPQGGQLFNYAQGSSEARAAFFMVVAAVLLAVWVAEHIFEATLSTPAVPQQA